MAVNNLRDLYLDELKDVYNAEMQLIEALPKMAQKASNSELQMAIEKHLGETRGHVSRLEQIFEELETKVSASEKCEAMKGIIKESDEMLKKARDKETRDAAMIAMAQKAEHYEIASYGTLCAYARQLGFDEQMDLLLQTLEEEKMTDSSLTQLAESNINRLAAT